MGRETEIEPGSFSDDARALLAVMPYLSWSERSKRIDSWLWREARDQLSAEEMTAVINRRVERLRDAGAIARFARQGQALVQAVAARKTAPSSVSDPSAVDPPPFCAPMDIDQALLMLAAGGEVADAASSWLDRSEGAARLRERLADAPGLAILALAADRSDSLFALTARDAFWSSMMGRD